MSVKLPVISGKKLVRYLERETDWTFDRQRGSHMVLIKEGTEDTLAVPKHDPLKKGTLRGILREAGVSREEFIRAVQERRV